MSAGASRCAWLASRFGLLRSGVAHALRCVASQRRRLRRADAHRVQVGSSAAAGGAASVVEIRIDAITAFRGNRTSISTLVPVPISPMPRKPMTPHRRARQLRTRMCVSR
ncbi:hypothetical protein WS86_30735 [Burkholderia savannae]|nr:hypothetical protein WS86_30735 [Burkholderia savannae]